MEDAEAVTWNEGRIRRLQLAIDPSIERFIVMPVSRPRAWERVVKDGQFTDFVQPQVLPALWLARSARSRHLIDKQKLVAVIVKAVRVRLDSPVSPVIIEPQQPPSADGPA